MGQESVPVLIFSQKFRKIWLAMNVKTEGFWSFHSFCLITVYNSGTIVGPHNVKNLKLSLA